MVDNTFNVFKTLHLCHLSCGRWDHLSKNKTTNRAVLWHSSQNDLHTRRSDRLAGTPKVRRRSAHVVLTSFESVNDLVQAY